MIVFCIIGILGAIFYGAATQPKRRSDNAQIETPDPKYNNFGRMLNPDGTPVRPSNDQIGHYKTEGPSVENSVGEQCIDGILYLFVTKNGKDFMAPKEDTFGYNVKCSE